MRLIIAAIAGTIIVFTWGFVSWTVLEFWSEDIEFLPTENTSAYQSFMGSAGSIPDSGAYVFPARPDLGNRSEFEDDATYESFREVATSAWSTETRKGPSGVLLVHPGGFDPMAPSMFVRGVLLEFAGAILLAVLLAIATKAGAGYIGRVGIGVAALAFAVVAGVLVPGNFMVLPSAWTRAMAGDMILGWGLALLVMAAIVGGPRRSGRYARS